MAVPWCTDSAGTQQWHQQPQHQWHQHQAQDQARSGQTSVPAHIEIQREIDAMQVVYTSERRELELLISELQEELETLRGHHEQKKESSALADKEQNQAGSTASLEEETGKCDNCTAGELRPPRQVRWRIDRLSLSSLLNAAPDATLPGEKPCVRERFRLEECPGVRFAMVFYPYGDATSEGSPPCSRLVLEVSGTMTEGLVLGVDLSIEVQGLQALAAESVGQGGGGYPGDRSQSCVQSLPSGSSSGDLLGSGELLCDGPRLPELREVRTEVPVVVTCCAELSVKSWKAALVRYETQWLQGTAGSESDSGEEDHSCS